MNTGKDVLVVKASGEKEAFSEAKLRRSLERVHASPGLIERIVSDVRSELRDGMSTRAIYARAFSHLRKRERPVAARYHLKQALMELGPTGHPFEKLISALLAAEGFSKIEVGKLVHGVCVAHEVDVVGEKDGRHVMVECKFHNQPGIKSDVKISLYVEARFRDLERAWQKKEPEAGLFHEMWLVTNTKLTSDAATFAECVGMKVVAWNYPLQTGLEWRIERAALHPITCLTTLSRSQKSMLLEKGVILCKELLENEKILSTIGIGEASARKVMDEARTLCEAH